MQLKVKKEKNPLKGYPIPSAAKRTEDLHTNIYIYQPQYYVAPQNQPHTVMLILKILHPILLMSAWFLDLSSPSP